MKALGFLLRLVQVAAWVVFFGCGLFIFVLPYHVWGWPGSIAAVLLPGLSQIAAMFYAGDPVNWYVFGIGTLATGVAFGAGDLAERCVKNTSTVDPV